MIHTSAENFPWHNTTLAVHFIRFISIALAMLTIVLAYKIALQIFPERPSIAIGTVKSRLTRARQALRVRSLYESF